MIIALAPSFHQAMTRLDPTERSDVSEAMAKLDKGLPSVRLHKLKGSDFVSFGVNRDARRVIAQRDGDVLYAVWVDSHDDAYAWAQRHRPVRVGHHVQTVAVEEAPDPESEPDASEEDGAPPPLAPLRLRELERFDIPRTMGRAVRRLPRDGLIELAVRLKPPLGEALLDLATEPDRIGPIWLQYDNRCKQIESGTYAEPSAEDAARSTVNAGHLWLPSLGQQAVQDALTGGLDAWRIFLHPSQQRLVERHFRGAAKVTGGPGTGKTVVALHRARHLLEEVFPEGRVLLTTFNRTLATQLEQLWAQLTADAEQVRDRAEISTLTALSQQILRDAGRPADLLTSREVLDACWEEALVHDTDGHGRSFLASEREHVIGRRGAWSEKAYLRCRRPRVRTYLNKQGRRRVWRAINAYDEALARRGGGDGLALAREATRVVADGTVSSPWDAIVCDELQDASAGELRLLAALTRGQDGTTRENALFLCGDGYQRLYASPTPLSHCGIDVRGRARILRLNYRTTEGIRAHAVTIAEGLDPDDLDEEDEDVLDGYRSLRGGPRPETLTFDREDDEAAWIATQDTPLLVLARTRRYRNGLAERLRGHGADVTVLEGRGDVASEGITVSTLHRSKGLEASRVVVAGRHLIPARFPGGDDADRALWERKEACLLYVGITRARDWAAITRVG